MPRYTGWLECLAFVTIPLLGPCTVHGQPINEDRKFSASDAGNGDQLGWSIAVDHGVVAVAAWEDDDLGIDSGSVYLFDAITGLQLFKLRASDGDAEDVFGVSVDIRDGIVAVGARNNDDAGSDSGSAYIFDATTGLEIAKLVANDAATDDRFGRSVAVGGGIVCVGSPLDDDRGSNSGSVYVYDAATGAQIRKLVPADGASEDRFGFSLAIDAGMIAIGAYHDNDMGQDSGSVYLYDAATGTQLRKVLPEDGEAADTFGRSIALSDGLLVVGALGDDLGTDSGSAYLFDASSGAQLHKLLPDDGGVSENFGRGVAINNGLVAVGAPFAALGVGAAYLFDAQTGAQTAKLLQSTSTLGDFFGVSVALDRSTLAVGALGDDSVGSAFIFDLCQADLTHDGVLDFFDISMFIDAYNATNPIADFTDDGLWDFFDISAFVTVFAAGCP